MQNLLRNMRYATRQLIKSPVFTLTGVLTLALGIGVNTAIFTVVYAVVLAPLPYPQGDQLVMVWSKYQDQHNSVAAQDYLDWKSQNTSFQDLNASAGGSFNLATKDQPEFLQGYQTTPGFYRTVGFSFQYGRDFLPEEGVAGREHVVILTNKLWKRLGSDPSIIGKPIMIDETPYTVVGVTSPGIADKLGRWLVVPLVFKPEQTNRDFHWLEVMGRLKPGVSIKQAQANMETVTNNLAIAYPKSNKGYGVYVEPLKNDYLPPGTIQTLWMLLGAVGFVLLIACVNVANLVLAKGMTRQREVAIRVSLGATKRDVFVQHLTESLLLAISGGLLGVGVGLASLRWLAAVVPPYTFPAEANFSLNLPILLFTFGVTTLSGLLFGYAPAWFATRVEPVDALKEGGRTGMSAARHRLRKVLVVGEFALSLALLAGAGLAIHSVWNLTRVDLGVNTEHVLTFSVHVPDSRPKDPATIANNYQQILASIRSVPGVLDASTSAGLPLFGPDFNMPFMFAGQADFADPSQRPSTNFGEVTPGYFATYGIQMIKGRAFTDQDNAGSVRVAVVNEEFVREYLKGKDPIQQRIKVEELIPGVNKLGPYITWQIVGVFHNVRGGNFRADYPEMDVPFSQSNWPSSEIGVRTAMDPETMTRAISAAVHKADSQAALSDPQTLDELKGLLLANDRFTMALYAAFALVALLLAAVGIYGVMAFTVAQREHELGLRIALGASRGRVVKLVLGEALVLAGVGLGLGLCGAYFVGRAMQSTLYGVGSLDLTAMAAVAMVLLGAALMASWLPARRAAAVNPILALRSE